MVLSQWGIFNFFLMQTVKHSPALDLLNGQYTLALLFVHDSVGHVGVTLLRAEVSCEPRCLGVGRSLFCIENSV